MNNQQIRKLLESEKKLTAYIDELESHKAELPDGAFKWLTTAENILQNRRANLEKRP